MATGRLRLRTGIRATGHLRARHPEAGPLGGTGSAPGYGYTCRFFIGIDNDDKFKVAKRIIGANGSNMKEIVKKSGDVAKLRLRGKGSGFAERDTNEESPEPLQLCISCPTQHGYEIARTCVEDLLLNVYDEYEDYCEEHGLECEPPIIRMTERPVQSHAHFAITTGASQKRDREREGLDRRG
ncbi:unnamed protein product [Symbiodinium necroappetens]|uniref:KHDC4/BBP-like KH-domain type I domain-containing protein n=1 Tax=Symbiodinium necroappetens TaxID=1628268 RepID=A0A812RQJ8_9DINO|nr:unnamed protein product [Symbiodinium necroappetens]